MREQILHEREALQVVDVKHASKGTEKPIVVRARGTLIELRQSADARPAAAPALVDVVQLETCFAHERTEPDVA